MEHLVTAHSVSNQPASMSRRRDLDRDLDDIRRSVAIDNALFRTLDGAPLFQPHSIYAVDESLLDCNPYVEILNASPERASSE